MKFKMKNWTSQLIKQSQLAQNMNIGFLVDVKILTYVHDEKQHY